MTRKTKNGIDLKEYGAMCARIDHLDARLNKFIDNEFHHLSLKVDWMFYLLIATLVGTVADLAIRLIK